MINKTSPFHLIRTRAAIGSLRELYFESGGVLPEFLKGMWTSDTVALKAAERYYTIQEEAKEKEAVAPIKKLFGLDPKVQHGESRD